MLAAAAPARRTRRLVSVLLTTCEVTRRPAGKHYAWHPFRGRARHIRRARRTATDGQGGRGYGGGMDPQAALMDPQAALEAVAWRRLLVSFWPWRSAL